jgi:Domain of unknown function (DUF4345)
MSWRPTWTRHDPLIVRRRTGRVLSAWSPPRSRRCSPRHGVQGPRLKGRLALQVCIALGATWSVGAGAWGVFDNLGGITAGLVSQGRYLSGLLLAIGLGYWSTIFDIERKTARFRLLTGLVAIGGLCRLLGVAMGDGISLSTAGPLLLELGLAPLLCFWQNGGLPALLAEFWKPCHRNGELD